MRLRIGTKWRGISPGEVVGVSQVTIGDRSWKCLKVVMAAQSSKTLVGKPTVLAEWYVAETGRTVFFRRYNGSGFAKPEKPTSFESLKGNIEVKYKGITFRHAYDCIPDIAFEKAIR